MNLPFIFPVARASAPKVRAHGLRARSVVCAVFLAGALTGCQTPMLDSSVTSGQLEKPLAASSAWATPVTQSRVASTSTDEETASELPKIPATRQLVFQVLAAELALQRNLLAPAYKTYIALANETHDPRMALRAVQIALHARSSTDALAAARLWHKYAPASKQAAALETSLLLRHNDMDEAEPLLADQLARIPATDSEARDRAILSIQAMVAQSTDHIGGLHLLQDLFKNDMQRPTALLAMARQQILANDESGAQQSLQNALHIQPDFEPAAMLMTELGPQERPASIAALTTYVANNPQSRNARVALAQLYLGNQQYDQAQQQIEALVKLNPHDLTPLLTLGMLQLQQQRYRDAQHSFKKYVRMAKRQGDTTDLVQVYFYLAQIAESQKAYSHGIKWLSEVKRGDPQYWQAQTMIAQLMAKEGKFGPARTLLASLTPSDTNDQILIASTDAGILFDAGLYSDAEARYAQANREFPFVPDLMYGYAMACEKNGEYDRMESLLRQIIEIAPDDPNAYNALGYSLADRGQRLDEAARLIQKAAALAPGDPQIQDSLGWVKFRSGDKEGALDILRRAYAQQPNPDIGAHLGEVLWQLGQQQEARKVWRDALKLDPSNATLRSTLQRFNIQSP